MRRTPWFVGYPSVVVALHCTGSIHHVIWRSGKLVVEHDDVAGELGLAAMGGEPPPCVRLLLGWRKLHNGFDPNLLAGLEEALLAWPLPPSTTHATYRSPSGPELLPVPLRSRATLAMVLRAQRLWNREGLSDSQRHHFEQCLASSLSEAVGRSLVPVRPYRPHIELLVSCAVAEADEPPSVQFHFANQRGHLHCRAPLSWLVDVWAKGLAVVDDTVVFSAERCQSGRCLSVNVLEWGLRGFYGIKPIWSAAWACQDRRGRWRLLTRGQ